MKAFKMSQLKSAATHKATEDKVLCSTEWIQLKEMPEGYIYTHEIRCKGQIVVILPYRPVNGSNCEFLVRDEVTPCWSRDATRSAMTGGIEDEDPGVDAIRELREEAGFQIMPEQLIYLGKCRASKSTDTYYHLFSVNLDGLSAGEAEGDGSTNDKAPSIWITGAELVQLEDAQAITAYSKLCAKLGIK